MSDALNEEIATLKRRVSVLESELRDAQSEASTMRDRYEAECAGLEDEKNRSEDLAAIADASFEIIRAIDHGWTVDARLIATLRLRLRDQSYLVVGCTERPLAVVREGDAA